MNSSKERAPVGFIGLGIMGASMAGHLLRASRPLHDLSPRILPGLTLALRQYEALAEAGEGRSGTPALDKRDAR